MERAQRPAAAIVVTYATTELDLDWVPADAPVYIVHNDDSLPASTVSHASVTHLYPSTNLGFGGGANLALDQVMAERVVLANPDMVVNREHWDALTMATYDELVVVPQTDNTGTPTSVVNLYPSAPAMMATGLRLGRRLPRGSRTRHWLARLLRSWGRQHEALQQAVDGSWPLTDYWVSAALVSLPSARLKSVGGFDSAYFLYMEDVDLCRRLGRKYPDMSIRMAPTRPATHRVGGSALGHPERVRIEAARLTSVRRYCSGQTGVAWRVVSTALAARQQIFRRPAGRPGHG
jgi:N-acetylglucosaminyl-diphospho-decaprenol L-rhamnosyltransferase